ncbi:hypothetical protein DRB96_38480 [Streptomyces sp. ICC1]|nr:hypothetical protein DRB89_37465 [Streptomyces sp. ICC4]AWZ17074.1 hypothetical protein DRB96_38480 [Streptomyces sp. ICC1]
MSFRAGTVPQGRSFVASLRDGLRPPLTDRPDTETHKTPGIPPGNGRGVRGGGTAVSEAHRAASRRSATPARGRSEQTAPGATAAEPATHTGMPHPFPKLRPPNTRQRTTTSPSEALRRTRSLHSRSRLSDRRPSVAGHRPPGAGGCLTSSGDEPFVHRVRELIIHSPRRPAAAMPSDAPSGLVRLVPNHGPPAGR